jgi:hypothetical protein
LKNGHIAQIRLDPDWKIDLKACPSFQRLNGDLAVVRFDDRFDDMKP